MLLTAEVAGQSAHISHRESFVRVRRVTVSFFFQPRAARLYTVFAIVGFCNENALISCEFLLTLLNYLCMLNQDISLPATQKAQLLLHACIIMFLYFSWVQYFHLAHARQRGSRSMHLSSAKKRQHLLFS